LNDPALVKVNFSLEYSPKLIKKKDATTTKDGSKGKGGHEFGARLAVEKTISDLSIAPSAYYIYSMKRKYTDSSDDSIEETGGHTLGFDLDFQYKVMKQLPINFGIAYGIQTKENDKDLTQGTTTEIDMFKVIILKAGSGFCVVDNTIFIGFDYRYNIIADTKMHDGTDTYSIKYNGSHDETLFCRTQF
jgi:hypothetical protein